jgi:hypothetical protein
MRRRWIVVALCLAAIAVGGVSSFDYVQRRQIAKRTACRGSLNRIRLTKLVYADEHGVTNGAAIPGEVIWRENRLIERCFSRGHYSISPVGVDPSYSYTGLVRVHGRLLGHSLR